MHFNSDVYWRQFQKPIVNRNGDSKANEHPVSAGQSYDLDLTPVAFDRYSHLVFETEKGDGFLTRLFAL